MVTNIFVLQPPGRQLAGLAPAGDSWTGAAPAASQEVAAAREGLSVPRLETGAVKPLPVAADRTDLVRAVQRELKAKGYETGAVDGVAGLVTRGAVMAYETDSGLALTAEPSEALLQHLVLGSADIRPSAGSDAAPGPEAEVVVRAVQRAFRQLGYITTIPDGRLNETLRRAIRKFEADRKLKPTGRISGELLAKLAGLASDALQASR